MAIRNVTETEYALAKRVFDSSLPKRERIWISDELGLGHRAFTIDGGFGGDFALRVGPIAFADCTSHASYQPGQTPTDQLFIHELTHVWQYDVGAYVRAGSFSAQCMTWPWVNRAYSIPSVDAWDNSRSWDDFNVEQQATLVETWYTKGLRTDSVLFPYIDKVLRRRGADKRKPLSELLEA